MIGRVVVIGVVLALGGVPCARATILVPMSDEDLVASSDLIATGTVEDIRTVLLGGNRVVTRITVAVERTVKGAAHPSVVVTEAGGVVGGRRVVVFGSPEYVVGERVLVFLRLARDGSLATNGLALGKYRVEEAAGAGAIARRTVPRLDARALAPFVDRIAALAAGQRATASDGRAGAAVAPADAEAIVPAFSLIPGDGNLPARWFEADCGRTVTFSRANLDDTLPAESATALGEALAAWTAVPEGSIALGAGPDATPTPSIASGTFDGRSIVQFNDPFGEVQDLVNCSGVLARGGFAGGASEDVGLRRTVSGQAFGRILEGDVVVNQGAGACLGGEPGLAETLAHEIGHTLGFGHSSENRTEPDPVLADALMYFRVHDDGRGASVRQDDVAAVDFSYPIARQATTAVGAFACEVGLGPINGACFGTSLTLTPFTLFERAAAAARRADAAASAKKRKKQLRAARRLLRKADAAIARRISGACGAGMRATVADRLAEVTALLAAP